jgi:hypothetical protein
MTTRLTHQLSTSIRGRLAAASLLVGALLVLGWALLAPISTANASEWAQVSCSLAGKPVSTEGWSPSWRIESSANEITADECSKGGALRATDEQRAGELQEAGAGAVWAYTAPAGSTIVGGTVAYSMIAPHGITWLSTPEDLSGNSFVFCVSQEGYSIPCAEHGTSGAAAIPDEGGTHLYLGALCQGKETTAKCFPTFDAEAKLISAEIILNTNATPSASGFTGPLLEGAASGNATMSFTAHDLNGPGVYSVTVKVDGEPVYSGTPDSNGGECATVGADANNVREFQNTQPCPQNVPVTIEVPTQRYPNGEHQLKVEVEDATGKVASAYDGPVTINNHPPAAAPSSPVTTTPPPERGPCNGAPCDEAAKLTAAGQPTVFTRALGHSATTLTGRLISPTGAPIKDAQVKLLQQIGGSAAVTQIASATTHADGSWSLKAPAGPSRLLQVVFYSHTLDTVPRSSLGFHENVQGAVSMHAPRRARLGQAVTFAGQLHGGYVPSGGESVQMEIFYSGRWRTIEVLPTASNGRWTYKYVFTLGAGSSYLFRAATVPNGGYPYTSSHSKTVRVTVQR